jgi:hypothetical protein
MSFSYLYVKIEYVVSDGDKKFPYPLSGGDGKLREKPETPS